MDVMFDVPDFAPGEVDAVVLDENADEASEAPVRAFVLHGEGRGLLPCAGSGRTCCRAECFGRSAVGDLRPRVSSVRYWSTQPPYR